MPRDDGAKPLDDRNRPVHMLWAAQEAMQFATGRSRAELETDRLLLRGLTHCIQEIGEAAARVSDETCAAIPQLPWAETSSANGPAA